MLSRSRGVIVFLCVLAPWREVWNLLSRPDNRFNTSRHLRRELRVPWDTFLWREALTLENLSLVLFKASPDHDWPVLVTAISRLPKSTPITSWVSGTLGGSDLIWTCI